VRYVLETLGIRLGQDYVRRAGLRIVTRSTLTCGSRANRSRSSARLQPSDLSNAALALKYSAGSPWSAAAPQ
jgi:hypothetical protein